MIDVDYNLGRHTRLYNNGWRICVTDLKRRAWEDARFKVQRFRNGNCILPPYIIRVASLVVNVALDLDHIVTVFRKTYIELVAISR